MSSTQSRVMEEIEVWGTIVLVECLGESEQAIRNGIAQVREYFEFVDEVFSTYKENSEVSRLRRGEIDISACCGDLQEVWNLCLIAKELTEGSFDPWCVQGGFDPSGYVKGWAADKAAAAGAATKAANTPTPEATPTKAAPSGITGTFAGATNQTRFGPVQVQITVSNGKITAVKALQYPNGDGRSASISQQAIPYLVQQTLTAQSDQISGVGGASYTSYGFYISLQSALKKAGL